MSHTEQTGGEMPAVTETMNVETARKVEQEKLTRRAALRKLGFGAGFAAFSLLAVDDLARMVGRRMERMAGDNRVAGQIAKEFQQAGMAFAGGFQNPSNTTCKSDYDCSGCRTSDDTYDCCAGDKLPSNRNSCCSKNFPWSHSNCLSCCESAYTGDGGVFDPNNADYKNCIAQCPSVA